MEGPEDHVTYYVVRRTLGEPAYRVRFLWFRLTMGDLLACAALWVGVMNLAALFGFTDRPILGMAFDPWWVILLTLAGATTISVLHRFRPEGHIERILMGWVAARFYTPRHARGDHHWTLTPPRARLSFRADGREFPLPRRERRAGMAWRYAQRRQGKG